MSLVEFIETHDPFALIAKTLCFCSFAAKFLEFEKDKDGNISK